MDKRQNLLYEIELNWRKLERSYRYMNMDYDLFMQEILKQHVLKLRQLVMNN